MNPFKKLQENSLYWRYRFVTRRWLALKRWMRSVRQPPMRQVRHRGATISVPGPRHGAFLGRGMTFVVATAALLTAAQYLVAGRIGGLAMSVLQLAILIGMVYVFTKRS